MQVQNDIKIVKYQRNEIHEVREEVILFLESLTDEKKAFWGSDLPMTHYGKSIRRLIDDTILLITARDNGKLVGVNGIRKVHGGLFYWIWPVIRGYSVVKKSHQGRGIGSNLVRTKVEDMENLFAFHLSIIAKNNIRSLRIIEKHDYVLLHEDSRFYYQIRTYNNLMSYLIPFFIPITKVVLRILFRN